MCREASSITVFEKFSRYWEQKLAILLTSCSKRLHMRNWDTILESHGRLDKTVYGESSVKVSRQRQQWVFFEFFTLLGLVFQVLKVRLIKICKIEPPDLLFLVPFISFYISRYHFSQIFRNSFRIIRKKIFRHEFSFLTDSLNPPPASPHPLNGQGPLSVTKVFCRCSLRVLQV